jgi:hypothetical protein
MVRSGTIAVALTLWTLAAQPAHAERPTAAQIQELDDWLGVLGRLPPTGETLKEAEIDLETATAVMAKRVAAHLPSGWKLDPEEFELSVITRESFRRQEEAFQRRIAKRAAAMQRRRDGLARALGWIDRIRIAAQSRLSAWSTRGSYDTVRRALQPMHEVVANAGFREVLLNIGHELVHAAQQQNHPEFFDELMDGDQCLLARLAAAKGKQRRALRREVLAAMTLVEGQASAIQRALAVDLPRDRTHLDWKRVAVGLLHLLSKEHWQDLASYERGIALPHGQIWQEGYRNHPRLKTEAERIVAENTYRRIAWRLTRGAGRLAGLLAGRALGPFRRARGPRQRR